MNLNKKAIEGIEQEMWGTNSVSDVQYSYKALQHFYFTEAVLVNQFEFQASPITIPDNDI